MAEHPTIVGIIRAGMETTWAQVVAAIPAAAEDFLYEYSAGEQLRFYPPKIKPEHRRARQSRIEAALRAGEAHIVIAEREKVTERYVRIIRGRLKVGTLTP
jgi:hypothetical protein